MQPARASRAGARRELDPESRAWLDDLRAKGHVRDDAIERLHALLLRAAGFEASRRSGSFALPADELDQIVQDSASDALVSILARLDDFRGLSRFTTWAYKFAILETAVKLRRRAWQDREIPRAPEGWELLADARQSPEADAEQSELLRAVRDAMATVLTPHQRNVLVAIALDDVPIDVLAERLRTTRGALYKTVHDARRKLRAALAAEGLQVGAGNGGGR
jgi:RNA polymerase sigma-70 factor (ECF subfamily)